MTFCNKNGECLIQCVCECYNEVCICGHREHNGYCPSGCCIPTECRNYTYCNVKLPKWVSFCHNGMCINCAVQMGKHVYTNQVEECCVCLEMIPIIPANQHFSECQHVLCSGCNYECIRTRNVRCPLCRGPRR